jgi:hypothetical protein
MFKILRYEATEREFPSERLSGTKFFIKSNVFGDPSEFLPDFVIKRKLFLNGPILYFY